MAGRWLVDGWQMAGRWNLSISYLSAFNSLLNNALHACWQIWYIFSR